MEERRIFVSDLISFDDWNLGRASVDLPRYRGEMFSGLNWFHWQRERLQREFGAMMVNDAWTCNKTKRETK